MENEEKKLYKIKNISSYLSLVAVVLSIEADQIEYIRPNIKETQDSSDELTILALYLATFATLIDLGTAKYEYDQIMDNINDESPLVVTAAKNLLLSRLLSVGAIFFLFKATFQAIEAREDGDDTFTPSPTGGAIL